MRVISHRGNLDGPGSQCELERVLEALSAGYEVELDVRDVSGVLKVGHDAPLYSLPVDWFLEPLASRFWFHAKDENALETLQNHGLRSFMHDDEPMAIVKPGLHVWWHPAKNATMLDVWDNLTNFVILDVAGHPRADVKRILALDPSKQPLAVCTDWCHEWTLSTG